MIKLIKKKDNFKNLKSRIKHLSQVETKVGYFDEQGNHKTQRENVSTEITYTQLAAIQFGGSIKNNIPARPVFDITMNLEPLAGNKDINNMLRRYFSNIDSKRPRISASFVMETIATEFVEVARSLFGDTTYIQRNEASTIDYKTSIGSPYANSPLMEWGALRDNMSFKINGVLTTP